MRQTKYLSKLNSKLNSKKLLTILIITILGMGVLFSIIYASPAIKHETEMTYLQSHQAISKISAELAPWCGNGICELTQGENPLNCPEDCYLP